MQSKQIYMVRKFKKTYIKEKGEKELFNQNYGSDGVKILFASEQKAKAKEYFNKIKIKAKKLKSDKEFYFYYFDKFTYDKDEIIAIEPFNFKHDIIKD